MPYYKVVNRTRAPMSLDGVDGTSVSDLPPGASAYIKLDTPPGELPHAMFTLVSDLEGAQSLFGMDSIPSIDPDNAHITTYAALFYKLLTAWR